MIATENILANPRAIAGSAASGGSMQRPGSTARTSDVEERMDQLREEIWLYEHRKLSDAEALEMIMEENNGPPVP